MKAKLVKTHGNHYDLWIDSKGLYTSTYQFTVNGNLLSRKNCQAIERGYDLDELADFYSTMTVFFRRDEVPTEKQIEDAEYISEIAFKSGFQKALELMGDKKFTEEDMFRMFTYGHALTNAIKLKAIEDKPFGDIFNDFIQSLQQTEWDVEVVMECCGNYSTTCNINCEYGPKPKLDADGCLILKLKSE